MGAVSWRNNRKTAAPKDRVAAQGDEMKKYLLILLACLQMLIIGTGLAERTPETILAGMTTEQKVAQLIVPSFYYYTNAEGKKVGVQEMRPEIETLLTRYGFGGVIFNLQNAQTNELAVRLVDAVQRANASVEGRTRLITCIDQEGGYVTRLGMGTQMPGNMALGAVHDLSMTEKAGRLMGSEVRTIGYDVTFAPVVDINNNPENPVIGIRSFGDNPANVAEQGMAMIRGLHDSGVLLGIKHFPGHGDTDTDSHTGLPCITKTYEQLKEFELIPFQACIDAGADMVMTAHIVFPELETGTYRSIQTGEEIGLPATVSKTILTDILRGDMGFKGLIVTDSLDMDAIISHFDLLDVAKLAIEAGADLLLRPLDTSTPEEMRALEQYILDVTERVDNGTISVEAVDAAVLRVLSFKARHGMLMPYESGDLEARVQQATETVGSAEHHAEEFEIAKAAVTLVKNEQMLPLKTDERIAILVPYASEVKSAEYAVMLAKQAGKVPADMDIPVFHLSAMTVGEMVKLCRETENILAVSTAYSLGELNPDTKSGSDSSLLDTVITMTHAAGNRIVVISAQLPYDVARYPAADAMVVSYGARGMNEDPRDRQNGILQYGPNIPAALYLLLSGEKMQGRLPVSIPNMDEKGHLLEGILYEEGFGL